MWCLAHRLELSLKDVFCGTLFSTIYEILLRIYYIYSKAPQKCRQLKQVIEELKACLDRPIFWFQKLGGADHSVLLEHVLLLTR